MTVIEDAQNYLRREKLDGWLVYEHRYSNPVFYELMDGIQGLTRPVFYFVPSSGEPTLVAHAVDAGRLDPLGGSRFIYSRRRDLVTGLRSLIAGTGRIAMEYVPGGALPLSSRVDGGTLEMIRGFGVEVVSSADLVQEATARWSESQLASHRMAARALTLIVGDGFRYISQRLADGRNVDELGVQRFLSERMNEEGLEAPDGPIVAVNAHTADPHYEPTTDSSVEINLGDWLLIDIWARQRTQDTVYADITWTAFVGEGEPSQSIRAAFETVIRARDATVLALGEVHRAGRAMRGHEADRVARSIIDDAGYADAFTHRLGHSIGRAVHGNGANLDGFETDEIRQLIRGTGFSIEPGIYVAGEFGVRSEINVYLGPDGPEITTPPQSDIERIPC
jgi:Xaa-Pro dipeptidase